MTDMELLVYYANLLILQYRTKPNATAFVTTCLSALIIYELILAVRDGYDIQTAEGSQLDVLGKYTGVSREITGANFTKAYFWFTGYGTTPLSGQAPFTSYGEAPVIAAVRKYLDTRLPLYSLTDSQMITAILQAIVFNKTKCTLKDYDDNINNILDGVAMLTDNGDMSITYTLPATYTLLFNILNDTGIIIKPMGIKMITVYT